jgi:hypothetical protein
MMLLCPNNNLLDTCNEDQIACHTVIVLLYHMNNFQYTIHNMFRVIYNYCHSNKYQTDNYNILIMAYKDTNFQIVWSDNKGFEINCYKYRLKYMVGYTIFSIGIDCLHYQNNMHLSDKRILESMNHKNNLNNLGIESMLYNFDINLNKSSLSSFHLDPISANTFHFGKK